jgi:hypothetical protein
LLDELFSSTPVPRLTLLIALTVQEDRCSGGHLIPNGFVLDQEIDELGRQFDVLMHTRLLLSC